MIDVETCVGCGQCEAVCPTACVVVSDLEEGVGDYATFQINQEWAETKKDKLFFNAPAIIVVGCKPGVFLRLRGLLCPQRQAEGAVGEAAPALRENFGRRPSLALRILMRPFDASVDF